MLSVAAAAVISAVQLRAQPLLVAGRCLFKKLAGIPCRLRQLYSAQPLTRCWSLPAETELRSSFSLPITCRYIFRAEHAQGCCLPLENFLRNLQQVKATHTVLFLCLMKPCWQTGRSLTQWTRQQIWLQLHLPAVALLTACPHSECPAPACSLSWQAASSQSWLCPI